MREEFEQFQLDNRQKNQRPKKGRFWCWNCDHCLISKGQKCPICCKKDISKKFKKRDIF